MRIEIRDARGGGKEVWLHRHLGRGWHKQLIAVCATPEDVDDAIEDAAEMIFQEVTRGRQAVANMRAHKRTTAVKGEGDGND